MVNISSDGTTVTPNTDFTNLATMYNAVSFINTPALSAAPSASYPSCPGQNSSFLASTTLPPTPSDSACQCLESSLSCQFNPQVANTTAIVGSLLDTACSLLGSAGGSCSPISANGQTGQYGEVSSCDPRKPVSPYLSSLIDTSTTATMLSFVMSEYFEANKRNPQSCSFSGNGTVNSKASTSSSASQIASSCLASATGTFVPTAPSSISPGSTTTGSGSKSGSTHGAATAVLVGDVRGLLGVFLMFAISVAGGLLSLA
jgi:hypothetical protein